MVVDHGDDDWWRAQPIADPVALSAENPEAAWLRDVGVRARCRQAGGRVRLDAIDGLPDAAAQVYECLGAIAVKVMGG